MKKSLTQIQENEFLFIKEWCTVILDYIGKRHHINSELIEIYKQAFGDETRSKYLIQFKPSLFMRGLKQAFNDTNEWASELNESDVNELNLLLKNQFGKDLSFYSKEKFRKINQIMKRGKISSDEEFRMINERVNEICQSEHNKSELEKLNDLLLKYETKNA